MYFVSLYHSQAYLNCIACIKKQTGCTGLMRELFFKLKFVFTNHMTWTWRVPRNHFVQPLPPDASHSTMTEKWLFLFLADSMERDSTTSPESQFQVYSSLLSRVPFPLLHCTTKAPLQSHFSFYTTSLFTLIMPTFSPFQILM
jgi:hypothetical protein